MSHVKNERVMSHMNESCHVGMSHATHKHTHTCGVWQRGGIPHTPRVCVCVYVSVAWICVCVRDYLRKCGGIPMRCERYTHVLRERGGIPMRCERERDVQFNQHISTHYLHMRCAINAFQEFKCPPAPMNHVKYLRAGPAEMPFQYWYTANTNHFHLTDSVRWKSPNQLGW